MSRLRAGCWVVEVGIQDLPLGFGPRFLGSPFWLWMPIIFRPPRVPLGGILSRGNATAAHPEVEFGDAKMHSFSDLSEARLASVNWGRWKA